MRASLVLLNVILSAPIRETTPQPLVGELTTTDDLDELFTSEAVVAVTDSNIELYDVDTTEATVTDYDELSVTEETPEDTLTSDIPQVNADDESDANADTPESVVTEETVGDESSEKEVTEISEPDADEPETTEEPTEISPEPVEQEPEVNEPASIGMQFVGKSMLEIKESFDKQTADESIPVPEEDLSVSEEQPEIVEIEETADSPVAEEQEHEPVEEPVEEPADDTAEDATDDLGADLSPVSEEAAGFEIDAGLSEEAAAEPVESLSYEVPADSVEEMVETHEDESDEAEPVDEPVAVESVIPVPVNEAPSVGMQFVGKSMLEIKESFDAKVEDVPAVPASPVQPVQPHPFPSNIRIEPVESESVPIAADEQLEIIPEAIAEPDVTAELAAEAMLSASNDEPPLSVVEPGESESSDTIAAAPVLSMMSAFSHDINKIKDPVPLDPAAVAPLPQSTIATPLDAILHEMPKDEVAPSSAVEPVVDHEPEYGLHPSAAEPLPETGDIKLDLPSPIVEVESPDPVEHVEVKTELLSDNIEGFENLSDEQKKVLMEYVKEKLVEGTDRLEDEEEVEEPVGHIPEAGINLDEIRKIENSDNRLEDIAPHHRIAADHISPNLYEESPATDDAIENDSYTDSYGAEDLNEVEYKEPADDAISWEEPEADRPNAVFHHYDDEDAYDSLKVSSDNDAYLDSNENENDVQLTQDDYFEFSGESDESIIDTIVGSGPDSGIFNQPLDSDDYQVDEQEKLQSDKYLERERKDEENSRRSYKGWVVFITLVGILFIATTRRKVRRLMPGNLRRSRSAGLITVDKYGKDSGTESE